MSWTPSMTRLCVCVLDFLSDPANLCEEDVGESYCILSGYSGELIHATP